MTRRAAAFLLVASCVGARPAVRAERSPAPSRSTHDALPDPVRAAPVWSVLAAGGVAGAIRDVGALSGGDAVILTERSIAVWTRGGVVAAPCVFSPDDGSVVGVHAEGDTFVAVAGDEGRVTLWRSSDRGVTCERANAPALSLRDTDVGRVGFTLHGSTLHLWSSGGAVVRSDDLGRSWRRLPTLAGVGEVAPGPGGRSLAAAALGAWGERRRLALHALNTRGDGWDLVDGAGHLRSPVTFSASGRDGVLVGDSAGSTWVPSDLTRAERRVDLASLDEGHAPRILVAAGEGALAAVSDTIVARVERGATRPIAALPGALPIRAIDAAADGWWWATDGRGLWRAQGDGPLEAAWAAPLGGEDPLALAARGGRVLVAGARAASVREVAGAWHPLTLPEGLGRTLAAHIDERGSLFVLTSNGLAVSDAMRFVAVPSPAVPVGVPARVMTLGERWLVASVAAWVSDDRGARWEVTYGDGSDALSPLRAVDGPPRVALGYAFARDQVVLVDMARQLARADVLGQRFEPFASLPTAGEGRRGHLAQAVVAWDGGARVAVLAGGTAHLSHDSGETFVETEVPFVPRWATWVDGVLVASGSLSRLVPVHCRQDARQSLFAYTRAGWVPDPAACEQRGLLVAQDGDDLWMVDHGLTLRRASLARLVATVAPR